MQDIDVAKLHADIEDGSIPGPFGQIGIRITRPVGAKEELPAVMYFRGGGWVVGDRDTDDRPPRSGAFRPCGHRVRRILARRKHSIPLRARRRTQRPRGSRRTVDRSVWTPSRLAVGGDSAGGNMAAVVALLARMRGGPAINYQVLFCPPLMPPGNAVLRRVRGRVFLTRAGLASAWNQYGPDREARRHPTASPLLATADQLAGLTPATGGDVRSFVVGGGQVLIEGVTLRVYDPITYRRGTHILAFLDDREPPSLTPDATSKFAYSFPDVLDGSA